MVIYKSIREIKENFDICDSIIYGIRWDENMLDLLIVVYYYVGPDAEEKTYVIRLKDCFEVKLKMTEWMQKTPANERQKYWWHWYTTFCMEIEKKDTLEIRILTDTMHTLIDAKCEEIWIEDDEVIRDKNIEEKGK